MEFTVGKVYKIVAGHGDYLCELQAIRNFEHGGEPKLVCRLIDGMIANATKAVMADVTPAEELEYRMCAHV